MGTRVTVRSTLQQGGVNRDTKNIMREDYAKQQVTQEVQS